MNHRREAAEGEEAHLRPHAYVRVAVTRPRRSPAFPAGRWPVPNADRPLWESSSPA